MKKNIIIIILLLILIILGKFYLSSYKIEYYVNNYKVTTNYKNGRFYFQIENESSSYIFDMYEKRHFKKTMIEGINEINGDDFSCIYPTIQNIDTYPLCIQNNNYIDYHLIDSELLDSYKEEKYNVDIKEDDFKYYNNLTTDEYMAIWTYKGYIVMNNKTYKNIIIFKSDRYDNSLAYQRKNIIYMPNYDEEYEFSSIITLDLESGKTKTIELGAYIDYDSYIVGSIKNKIYIYDNKNSILYEFNTKNNNIKILGDSEKGYIKYVDGKEVSCSKTEYKVNKITYSDIKTNSYYIYNIDNGTNKIIKDNKSINTKIINDNVGILNENENNLYYLYDGIVYKYNPYSGQIPLVYNYELKFNSDSSVFIFIK